METQVEPLGVSGASYIPIYDEVVENEQDLSVSQHIILCLIIYESDQRGYSCRSINGMASCIRGCRNTVKRALRKLCEKGLIRVEHRKTEYGGHAPIRCYSLKYSHRELCGGWVDEPQG